MLTNDQIALIAKTVAVTVAQTLLTMQAPTQQPKAAKPVSKPAFKALPKAAPVSDRKAAFAAQVVATFKAKGLSVKPNVDVLTFGKWEAIGFRPKAGEHATFVKAEGMNGNGIALFHKEQVERIA